MKSTLTPLEFLERSAFVFRDRVAVVDGELRFTYAEMSQRVQRAASSLQELGIGAGDRIAVLSCNTPAALEAHFAVPAIGAVLVMLNIRSHPAELAWILNHCDAKALITDPDLLPLLDSVRRDLGCLEHIVDDYEGLLTRGRSPCSNVAEPEEDGLLAINYTSGTTGFPKGVMYTHRGAYLNALGEVIEMGLSSNSVYLWTLPMFHCNGWCFPWAVTAPAAGTFAFGASSHRPWWT
jgi:fatty-acyl-CoA synthase